MEQFSLIKRKKLFELSRYAVVGILTAFVDYASFSIIYYLSNNYLIAENLKLPFMLAFNYTAHRIFTFKSSNKIYEEIGRYIFANIIIFVISNLSLIFLVNALKMVYIAKFVQLILMPLVTYTILNKLVYKK